MVRVDPTDTLKHERIQSHSRYSRRLPELGHAAACVLNLGENPEHITSHIFLLRMKAVPGDTSEPRALLPDLGFVSTITEAKENFGPLFNLDAHIAQLTDYQDFCSAKPGCMGAVGVILRYEETADFVFVKVPPVARLRHLIEVLDWRSDPVCLFLPCARGVRRNCED